MFQNNTVIIVTVDQFSKFLCLLSLPGLPSTIEAMELIFNHVVKYFGIPEDTVSDWGAKFTSKVSGGFMEKVNPSA